MKKIHCYRCGSTHLQFINVPCSIKGDCKILTKLCIASYFLAIINGIIFITQFTNFIDEKTSNIIGLVILVLLPFIAAIGFLLCGIVFTVMKYYIPYKNDNVVRYVCCTCGNCEDLDLIKLNDNECEYSETEDAADS